MQLVVILIIIFVIIVIISIVWCILQIFFAFLFLFSANTLLFIEKCFFISNAIPPWVTWGIFGLFIGLLLAAYKSASHSSSYRHLRPLFIILPILALVGLGTYNVNRLRESSEKITHPDPKTSQPKRYSQAKTASQKTQNLCFATVPSDRWKGEYYNNKNLSGSPSMVRDDGNGFIHFDWGNYSPRKDCGIDADNFSVRWMRTIYFEGGTYRFTATADGFNLYINDVLRLERWHDQLYAYTVDVPLATGNHAIKMEYYNDDRSDFVKLSWQVLSTPIQSSVAVNIAGEWEGKVDNMPAKLSITQNGNSLSGNIVYDNIKEYLSGEINSDQIILRGTHHDGEIKEGKSFALDTFSGTISGQDGDSIRGNYTDEAGHSGSWFVTKQKSPPHVATQKVIPNHDILSDDEVITFIEKWACLDELDEIVSLYADEVDFYDKGQVDKAFIRERLTSSYKEFPYRKYKLISPIKVVPDNSDNKKTAKYTIHFVVSNDQKTVEGDGYNETTLQKQGNRILVIRDKGKIKNRQIKENREFSNNNRKDETNRISSFFSTLQDSNRNRSTRRDSSVKVKSYTTTKRHKLFDKEKEASKPKTETRVKKQVKKKPKKSKKSKKKSK